jgi:hypothetical protein
MLVPEIYEFEHAIRFGGKTGVTSIRASECEVYLEDHWLVFVDKYGSATKVPRENVHYIYGKWFPAATAAETVVLDPAPKKKRATK